MMLKRKSNPWARLKYRYEMCIRDRVIVDPFRSLSRLKQLVTGKKTREDHPQVMNAAVRLYADAANAKTKMENGFDLTDYDNRTLSFAKDYSCLLYTSIDSRLFRTFVMPVANENFFRDKVDGTIRIVHTSFPGTDTGCFAIYQAIAPYH